MVKNSAGTSTLRTQNWVYDGVGNTTARTIDTVTTTYRYDNIHQLLSESRSGHLLEYTYDANGNRLSKTLNSGTPSTYTYADDDRLLTTPHGTITYDAAGRPTAYPISSTVTRYFTWDYDDRLLGYQQVRGTGFDEAYTYNGAGARVKSDHFMTGVRKDLRSGIGVTSPVVSTANGSGTTTVSYLPGIAEKRGSTKSYQHSGLKNVDAQTNSSAAISATRECDAFGGVISSTGTFNGPFGHAGAFGYQSEGSGLQLLGHRWYDPEVGRFLTRDPIHDGKNWYIYCRNNPLGMVDPDGLLHIVITIGPDGNGTAIVYADEGDIDTNGNELKPGQVVMKFPVYNDTKNDDLGDVNTKESNARFPPGTYPIEGTYLDYKKLGTTFKLKGGSAARRGTWLHSGKGENYQEPTEGCIRAKGSDLLELALLILMNQVYRQIQGKDPGGNDRLTAGHVTKKGQKIGGGRKN